MSKALSVAKRNLIQEITERLYIASGIDFTKPVQVVALVTERCTAKCKMCNYWRKESYEDELPADIWVDFVKQLKEYTPGFHIQFTGGEPFFKPDFMDILQGCGELGVSFGVVSNGELINEKNAKEIVATGVNNINISLDSPHAEIHDELRNKSGLFSRAIKGIGLIRKYSDEMGRNVTVSIKPTLHNQNLDDMPLMLEQIPEWGASVLNIQPLRFYTDESNELAITDFDNYEKIVNKLVEMQKEGYPLANSERQLMSWIPILKNEPVKNRYTCRVGMRLLSIYANGDCYYCLPLKKVFGNIAKDSAKKIWTNKTAKNLRAKSVKCKIDCTASCYAGRTFLEKTKFFFKMFGK